MSKKEAFLKIHTSTEDPQALFSSLICGICEICGKILPADLANTADYDN